MFYEYTYNEEGYVVSETATEAIVHELFEESFELFMDEVLFKGVSWENTTGLQELWKYFYEALHFFCNHNDADGDGQPDNCLYGQLTATTEYTYIYDDNWQLTKCVEKGQYKGTTTYEYWYDEDGNRTKYVKTYEGEALECYTYTYNASNQLVSRTNERLWTDNVTHYTYDADGNMISEATGCIEKTYEYTAENRLTVVRLQGQVLMAALYDGDGNRLFSMDYTGGCDNLCGHEGCSFEECIFHNLTFEDFEIWIPDCGENDSAGEDGSTVTEDRDNAIDAMKELASLVSRKVKKDYTITEYVNDMRVNEEVLAELNLWGRTTKAYIYGNDRIAYDTGEDISYYLYDGLGNVSRIATEWGRIKETYDYDPYGNLTFGIPDSVNYYGYNGESTNLATGLQYLRARYYHMANGSFLSEDTYAGKASEPLTLNRYTYVSNNPINFIDPSGHSILDGLINGLKDIGNAIVDGVEGLVNTATEAWNDFTGAITGKNNTSSNTYRPPAPLPNISAGVQAEISGSGNGLSAGAIAAINGDSTYVNTSKEDKVASETAEEIQKNDDEQSDTRSLIEQSLTISALSNQVNVQNGINFCEWLKENETPVKLGVGGTIIAVTGIASVCTKGAAVPFFLGSLFGGLGGGITHAIFKNPKENWEDAFADGFMWGSIVGVASPSISALLGGLKGTVAILNNQAVLAGLEGLLETVIEESAIYLQGGYVDWRTFGSNWAINSFTSGETPHMQKLYKWLEGVIEEGRVLVKEILNPKTTGEAIGESIESGIKGGSNFNRMDLDELPQNVQDIFKKYDDAGWQGNVSGQTPGTNAGRRWTNRDGQLPTIDADGNPITYREFDVNNYNGVSRDGERFIVGSDGSVWYTDSHYGQGESLNGIDDFVQIK